MAVDGSVIIEIIGDAQKFANELNGVAKKSLKTLTIGVGAATTALGGLAASCAKVGSSFEASMSQVAATMAIDRTSEEFAIMEEAAKKAGETTAFSASQAAEALNYLALAGYDAQKAADTLPAVLDLAAAGGMDLAYASDLATDAMAALGIEASSENLTAFGDELAMTASKANASVSQLGEAILTVGGTAKSLAGGTAELNASLGVLANRGIKGSEGGTALRNMILSLSAPTDKAKAKLDSLGVSVYDAAGKMRPLNEVFKDLDGAMADMTEGQKTEALNEIFNKVDLKSAQAMLAGCGEEFDNLAAAINGADGAMADMAARQLDNLEGDITILKSAIEGVQIKIYEGMQPALRAVAQEATDMVGQISKAFDEGGMQGAIAAVGSVAAQAVVKLAEAAPAAISAGAQLLGAFVRGIIEALPQVANTAMLLVIQFGIWAQNALPELGETAGAMVSGFAEFVKEKLPLLNEAAARIVTGIGDFIANALPELIPAAIDLIASFAQHLLACLPAIAGAAVKIVLGLGEGILKSIPKLLVTVGELGKAMVQAFVDIGKNVIAGLWQGIKDSFGWVKDKVSGLLGKLVGGAKEDLDINSPSRVFAEIGDYCMQGLAVGMQDSSGEVVKAQAEISKNLLNGGLLQGLQKLGVEAETEAQGLTNGFCETVADKQGAFVDTGLEAMAGFLSGLHDKGEEAVNYAKNVAERVISSMRTTLDIHSPSRKMATLVGAPAGEGVFVGFEKALAGFHERAQRVVESEIGRISVGLSAKGQAAALGGGTTREVITNNRTVERVTRVEGDGLTDDLIRMLRLRLKDEDNREGIPLGV